MTVHSIIIHPDIYQLQGALTQLTNFRPEECSLVRHDSAHLKCRGGRRIRKFKVSLGYRRAWGGRWAVRWSSRQTLDDLSSTTRTDSCKVVFRPPSADHSIGTPPSLKYIKQIKWKSLLQRQADSPVLAPIS